MRCDFLGVHANSLMFNLKLTREMNMDPTNLEYRTPPKLKSHWAIYSFLAAFVLGFILLGIVFVSMTHFAYTTAETLSYKHRSLACSYTVAFLAIAAVVAVRPDRAENRVGLALAAIVLNGMVLAVTMLWIFLCYTAIYLT